jgi:hypothetical protein
MLFTPHKCFFAWSVQSSFGILEPLRWLFSETRYRDQLIRVTLVTNVQLSSTGGPLIDNFSFSLVLKHSGIVCVWTNWNWLRRFRAPSGGRPSAVRENASCPAPPPHSGWARAGAGRTLVEDCNHTTLTKLAMLSQIISSKS